MEKKLNTIQLTILGMTCTNCSTKIEKHLKTLRGVKKVSVSYQKGIASITYDESEITLKSLKEQIKSLDYLVGENKKTKADYAQLIVIFIVLLGGYVIFNHFGFFDFFNFFPEAKEGMSLLTLFVIGLLTSVHCIGMCGGINLSQCLVSEQGTSKEKLKSNLLYNGGRILSYTVLGGLVGLLGSVFSVNGFMRGAVALFAGVFMIIMGLNMLNVFPPLKRLSVIIPKSWNSSLKKKNNSPFYIGLLNGLMPCGPLQSMQLFALSTGDPIQGALSMFIFSLGTLPLMFGFGALGTLLSKKSTATMMKVSATLVVILGLGMINTGISMSGFMAFGTRVSQDLSTVKLENGYQIVEIEVGSRSYDPITVEKGVPVKFNLHVDEKNLNGCNNEVVFPKYGVKIKLQPGDNWVEFTPLEEGVFPYSCWMNMIRSSITVTK